ncbi:MAG: glycosyltransferase family 4 protein [Chloroflexota bacterium]|nr:glycosyltransferase family 4 protein [Chloroflexota bacterium]
MKLALVSDALDPTNGWGRYAGELARELIRAGVDVRLVSPRSLATMADLRDYPDHAEIPSFQHGRRHPLRVLQRTLPPLFGALRGADAIHCMVEPYAPAVALAAGRRPYFVSLVGTYSLPSGRPPMERWPLRRALRRARGLPAISDYTRRQVERDANVQHTSVVPLAVRAREFQREHPPPREPGLIVSVGECKPRKGFDLALEAFARLKAEGVANRYVIVGPVSASSRYAGRLRDRIRELGLDQFVTLTGVVSQDELVDWYHKARVVTMPYRLAGSDFDGFGLVLLEANACGTPVVSARDSGAEEPVVHDENGLLVPPNDVSSLTNALRTVLTDAIRWQSLASGARRRADAMSWRRSAQRLLDVYADALGRRLEPRA